MTEKVMMTTFFGSSTKAELMEDGYWKVVCDMQEAFKNPDTNEWDSRCISAMSLDKIKERAYETAYNSVVRKFEQLEYNLFKLPKEESTSGNENPVKDYQAETS